MADITITVTDHGKMRSYEITGAVFANRDVGYVRDWLERLSEPARETVLMFVAGVGEALEQETADV